MKNLRTIILSISLLIFMNIGYAQDFMMEGWKKNKTYILLAHPTVQNIETIHFLLENKILQLRNAEFVGVYPAKENYDYGQSIALLKEPGMEKFHLLKVAGTEDSTSVYTQNDWTQTFKELFDHSVGIIFFGGPDIQPELYRQKNLYSEVTDPNRHAFELSFLFHLLGGTQNTSFTPFLKEKPGYCVTGFCLGLQSMNVATGGTLTQDIPAQKYHKTSTDEVLKLKKEQLHRNYWQEASDDTLIMGISLHPIEFTAHPFFTEIVKADEGQRPVVVSNHHQAIQKLGKDLIVTATSLDGQVIEGIHHRIYPNVFAVQFHPEVSSLYQEDEKLKFTPTDTPKSLLEILSKEDQEFHYKYWKTITKAMKTAERMK